VQNVNYRQSVYQPGHADRRTVDFDTAATDDYNFVFAAWPEPADVVYRVDQATGAASAGSHGSCEPNPLARDTRRISASSSLACRARHAPCVLDLLGSPAPEPRLTP